MKKTKLKVSMVGPSGLRYTWTGFWEDHPVLIKTRSHLEDVARNSTSITHGVGWEIKSVSITFPPLNPAPRTRRVKG